MNSSAPAQHPAFTLLESSPLSVWNSRGDVYLHRSGAQVLSLCNQDPHKTFGIVFPTPPRNHTGLPHILEHCVLCGSEKYPVKEPFKEMLKTSLQTFLNAFTYPDRTCYPVSSQNLQDFYHLMDVYLDAVFFPRLSPAVLGQEGWRTQWNQEGRLEIQGVVFNEMKGVYASPESRMDELLRQALFPDTPYRFDYGGQPRYIRELDFESFQQFHREHYHPANALVGFYGDDDPYERLVRLHEIFDRVPDAPVPPRIPLQPRWEIPRSCSASYPAVEGSDEGLFCQLNWLLPGEQSEPEGMFMASMCASLLLNSPASPLRQALLDSGLGEEIIGGPLLYLRQPAFCAGLKGVEEEDATQVFECVLECLEKVAAENFRPDLIEGLLHMQEFQMRELNLSNKGLSAILQAVQPWIYGGNPLQALQPEPLLENLREKLKDNPRLFADWIRENLLDNPSRLELTLSPDPELAALEAAEESETLQDLERYFSENPEARRSAEELAAAVETFQNTPDSVEATAKLPKLTLADISPLPPPPPFHQDQSAEVAQSSTEVPSNQIAYLQFAFDFKHLTLEELSLLPLYSRCLTELGTDELDQVAFNEQISCHSGGIQVNFETSHTYREGELLAVMMLKTKCLGSRIDPLLNLLEAMLNRPRLGPADKIHQLLLEERSNEEADLIQSGNQVVTLRLRAAYSPMERATEEMDGICYLMRLRELEKLQPEALLEQITSLHQRLISQRNLRFHAGGDAETLEQIRPKCDAFLRSLPAGESVPAQDWKRLNLAAPEGLCTASPVQFVGLATRLDLSATENHFSHFVAQRLINNDYLWERVRMKGGAYGSSCSYSHLDGTLCFSSYRDPHLDQTLTLYLQAGDWLKSLSLDREALEQAVIGTLGKMSPPEKPSSTVSKSFFRHLIGLEHSRREQFWREIQETTSDHLAAYGEALQQAVDRETRICVLGGESALNASSRKLQITRLMS